MKAMNALNVLDSIIPISLFNKGQANKIFSDVKKFGTRIVVKNNVITQIEMVFVDTD